VFFVSVADKGVRFSVSSLDATLVRWCVSVASKRFSWDEFGRTRGVRAGSKGKAAGERASWVLAGRGANRVVVDRVAAPHRVEL
jgi:hypothetical protein